MNLPLDEKDDEAAGQDASEDDVTAPESDEPYEDDNPDYDGHYVLPNSATHLYMGDELAAMSDWELYIARNEIFARHGRTFQKEDLQSYFDGQEWYEPRYSPDEFDAMVGTLLNDTERANASTILSIEQERGSAYV